MAFHSFFEKRRKVSVSKLIFAAKRLMPLCVLMCVNNDLLYCLNTIDHLITGGLKWKLISMGGMLELLPAAYPDLTSIMANPTVLQPLECKL